MLGSSVLAVKRRDEVESVLFFTLYVGASYVFFVTLSFASLPVTAGTGRAVYSFLGSVHELVLLAVPAAP